MYRGERFNSISHLVGAVLAAVASVCLIVVGSFDGDPWKVVSFTIYGFTLLLLYSISTLYHSLKGRSKTVFKILDYQAIYLLIAGTYTPFALVTLRHSVGWWLFGATWTLALVGIVLDAVQRDGKRVVPMVIYIVMGWMILLALDPLLADIAAGRLSLVACRRHRLLRRYHFLRARPLVSACPRHLAPIRARRQPLSLSRDTVVRLNPGHPEQAKKTAYAQRPFAGYPR